MSYAAVGLLLAGITIDEAQARSERPDRSWKNEMRKPEGFSKGSGVSGLPHSDGKSFATLDQYLAHLKAYAAPIGRPWYREIRPGVFEIQRGSLRNGTTPPVYTREELERRFGFQ